MYWIWTSIGWPILSVFHFYYSQKHTLSVYNRVWEETWFVIDWWTWYLKFCSFLIKLGTCIPIFFWVVVLRSFNLLRCKIIFVESFCRVEKYGFLFLKWVMMICVVYHYLERSFIHLQIYLLFNGSNWLRNIPKQSIMVFWFEFDCMIIIYVSFTLSFYYL